jgi:hypothetical protein
VDSGLSSGEITNDDLVKDSDWCIKYADCLREAARAVVPGITS